jgi:hypothetical protein
VRQRLGNNAFATTARARVCFGGSSVSNGSGRTDVVVPGRDGRNIRRPSARPRAQQASIEIFSPGSRTHRSQPAQPVIHGVGVAHGLARKRVGIEPGIGLP